MNNEKLMVIDGSSLLHRAFYALPLLSNKEGVYTNGVYGFLTMLYRIRDEYKPEYICVAFDKKGPTIRHKEYKEYKSNRQKTPSELAQQFPIIRGVLKAMNVDVLEMDQYEADDIAGTLAKRGEEKGLDVILVTGDKDYLQLAGEKTRVLLTRKGISEMEVYDRDKVLESYEISADLFVDLKGLMGDKSDNIPGVPGVGEKTGIKLIREFGSMEAIYENLDKVSGKKLKEKLIENKSLAFLSKKLSQIIVNVPLELEVEDLISKEADYDSLMELFKEYEFKSLIDKISDNTSDRIEEKIEYVIEDLSTTEDIIERIKKHKKFSFKFLVDGENYLRSSLLYLGIKLDEKIYFLNLADNIDLIRDFKEVFEDEAIEKTGYYLKNDMKVLFRYNIGIKNYSHDAMIAQYLINPSQSDYSINKISQDHLGYYGVDEEELLGKGKKKVTFKDIDIGLCKDYLGFILETVWKSQEKLIGLIEDMDMMDLYENIELPLTEALASMETLGFKVDQGELEILGLEYQKEIDSLTGEIYEMAGEDFNINSPKQIGDILFNKLELPVIKKTKTGFSTDVEVLEKLMDKHPIIEKIIRYRQIVKLKSTYIDGLSALIDGETGRIHSSFNQTITTTGRISSTEPNLQNIPIKTEDGRKIRKAFVAEGEDYSLLDADYSQIELRVLAHISGDEKMIESFKNDEDIHSKTASQVFHIPMDQVDYSARNRAKAVNFGIVYGISDYGLSRDLNIPRKEAKEYIDKYLENYIGVRNFMEDTVKEGREKGYVETLLNRRRYVPELSAKNFNIRSFGERIAMNTPIQGSAADIIKAAMVRVYEALRDGAYKSRLILQVHDELIIEVHRDELDDIKLLLRDIMEKAIDLKVPLKVDMEVGESWYETH